MEDTVTISRTCELPFEEVSQLLKQNPGEALRPVAPGVASRATTAVVHLHPRWPWRTHDEAVMPRIGRLEPVSAGRARLNLSWQAVHPRRLPTIEGHLEINRMSTDVCEIRYVGQYPARGIGSKVQAAVRGRHVVDDAATQLLDTTVKNIQQHLAAPL